MPGYYKAKQLFRIFPGLGEILKKEKTKPPALFPFAPQYKSPAKQETLSIFNAGLFSAVFTVTLCALQSHTPINN